MSTMSRKHEEREFLLECIRLYRELPALWDIKSEVYRDRSAKQQSYEILLTKYREKNPDADNDELKRKLNCLRTNFRKELKKVRDSIARGRLYTSTAWYYNEMMFLCDHLNLNSNGDELLVNQEDDDVYTMSQANTDIELVDVSDPLLNSSFKMGTKRKSTFDELKEKQSAPTLKHLVSPDDYYLQLAKTWAFELSKISLQQQLFVKKGINDLLFEGQMGTLHRNSVQINVISGQVDSSYGDEDQD